MLDQMYEFEVRSETNGRENNEDSFHISTINPRFGKEPIVVLALADGMGGHAYGEHASRETLRKVSLTLYEQLAIDPAINHLEAHEDVTLDSLGKALWSAIEQANTHVRRMVVANKWGMSGSTIVIAAITGGTAIVANLGDSPLFHLNAGTKRLKKLTRDHTVAGVLLEAGIITPEMARFHEGRSRLEFHVGVENLPREIPVYQTALAVGDLLLLCSDGVSASLLPEQISRILASEGLTLKDMADQLLEASRDAGETDNQTLILWRHVASRSTLRKADDNVDDAESHDPTNLEAIPPIDESAPARVAISPGPKHEPLPQQPSAPGTPSPSQGSLGRAHVTINLGPDESVGSRDR